MTARSSFAPTARLKTTAQGPGHCWKVTAQPSQEEVLNPLTGKSETASPLYQDVDVVVSSHAWLGRASTASAACPSTPDKVTIVGSPDFKQPSIWEVEREVADATMKVVESSSYRAARRAVLWIGAAARFSLLGRLFGRLGRTLGPVFAASEAFGLRRIPPRPLAVARSRSPYSPSRDLTCG